MSSSLAISPTRPPQMPFDIFCVIFKQLAWLGYWWTLERCARVHPLWHREIQKYALARILPMTRDDPSPDYMPWKGHLLSASAHPSRLSRLEIRLEEPLSLNWLEKALTSLPRLRHVTVYTVDISRLEEPTSPLPLSLDSVVFRDGGIPQDAMRLLYLIRFFSRSRSIIIDSVSLSYNPASTQYDTGITPTSVTMLSWYSFDLSLWCRVFEQSSSAPAIRDIRFAVLGFADLHHARAHSLIKKAINLETIEFDFFTRLQERVHTILEVPYPLIEEELAAAFPSSLQTLALCLPKARWNKSKHWAACMALLRSVPTTLRHIQVRVSSDNRNFGVAPFAECLRRLPDLQTLEVVLSDQAVMLEDAERIAAYRAFLQNGFPDLAARGALRLTQETRPF